MDILDRNAKCPMCGKFYHRIDIHKNPIPNRANQRTPESLCQCPKGQDAREFRRMKSLAIEAEQERQQTLREEWFNRDERNKAYWTELEQKKRR